MRVATNRFTAVSIIGEQLRLVANADLFELDAQLFGTLLSLRDVEFRAFPTDLRAAHRFEVDFACLVRLERRGTEAAAGVIQIFTKNGRSGKPQWSLQVDGGFAKSLPFGPDMSIAPPSDIVRIRQRISWLVLRWRPISMILPGRSIVNSSRARSGSGCFVSRCV